MKFGLFYLPTYLPAVRDAQTHYRGIIEQIEFADRIGIDYAWIVEHHFVRHGFDFGVGRGFVRDEFGMFGVDMKESRERVEEGVELVKQAWAGPTMEFNSKFRPVLSGMPLLPP